MPFTCSICEEESTRICVNCTKDSCENHLCEKCGRCSDCCGCEVSLTEAATGEVLVNGNHRQSSPIEPAMITPEDGAGEAPDEDFPKD